MSRDDLGDGYKPTQDLIAELRLLVKKRDQIEAAMDADEDGSGPEYDKLFDRMEHIQKIVWSYVVKAADHLEMLDQLAR